MEGGHWSHGKGLDLGQVGHYGVTGQENGNAPNSRGSKGDVKRVPPTPTPAGTQADITAVPLLLCVSEHVCLGIWD